MTSVALASPSVTALVSRAASRLANARSSAEVLDARDMASIAYDAAKRTARLAKAKQAHDELIQAAYRAQADAAEIEYEAKRRLADEIDAARARGEVATDGRPKTVPDGNGFPATAAELGLSRKDIHEARIIRDAEKAEPGIVRRAIDERLARGEEPSKAAIREAVLEAAERGLKRSSRPRNDRRNPLYQPNPQYGAILHVVSSCEHLFRTRDFAYLLGGFIDDDMRDEGLQTIREAHTLLTQFLEFADAQQT